MLNGDGLFWVLVDSWGDDGFDSVFGNGLFEKNVEQEFGISILCECDFKALDLISYNSINCLDELLLDIFIVVSQLNKMSRNLITRNKYLRQSIYNIDLTLDISSLLLFAGTVSQICSCEEELVEGWFWDTRKMSGRLEFLDGLKHIVLDRRITGKRCSNKSFQHVEYIFATCIILGQIAWIFVEIGDQLIDGLGWWLVDDRFDEGIEMIHYWVWKEYYYNDFPWLLILYLVDLFI